MQNKKIASYLLYAVGEVILVVIGILIAVSLNNWNAERKAMSDELLLLETMLKDLRSDSSRYAASKQQQKRVEELHTQLFLESRNSSMSGDTLNLDRIRKGIFFVSIFLQNQSENVQEIRNDSLREALSAFVKRLEATEQAKIHYQEYLDNHLKPYFAQHGIHQVEVMFSRDGYAANQDRSGYVSYQILKDQYGTKAFDEHLFSLAMRNSWYLTMLESVIQRNQVMREKVNNEIMARK